MPANSNNVESMEMSQQPNMAAQTQTTNEQPVSTFSLLLQTTKRKEKTKPLQDPNPTGWCRE